MLLSYFHLTPEDPVHPQKTLRSVADPDHPNEPGIDTQLALKKLRAMANAHSRGGATMKPTQEERILYYGRYNPPEAQPTKWRIVRHELLDDYDAEKGATFYCEPVG